MRALFWLLTLAAMAVGLALAARYNEGYMLIVLPPWRIELSLNLFLLLAVLGFIFVWLLARTIGHLLSLPSRVSAFRLRKRREAAENALYEAWRLIQEGRYGHAERSAEAAWEDHPRRGLVALAGWRAANALRDEKRAAPWLARLQGPEAEGLVNARLMMEAELALEQRRFEDARDTLKQLMQQGGRHIAALRLCLRAERGLGNWVEVAKLTRQLEKTQALTPAQAAPIRRRAVREALLSMRDDPDALKRYWKSLDETDRQTPGLGDEVEVWLKETASGSG